MTFCVAALLLKAAAKSPPPTTACDPDLTPGSAKAQTSPVGPTVGTEPAAVFVVEKLASRNVAWFVIAQDPFATLAATSPNAVELIDATLPNPAFTYFGFCRIWPRRVNALSIEASVNFVLPLTHES